MNRIEQVLKKIGTPRFTTMSSAQQLRFVEKLREERPTKMAIDPRKKSKKAKDYATESTKPKSVKHSPEARAKLDEIMAKHGVTLEGTLDLITQLKGKGGANGKRTKQKSRKR